MALSVTYQAFKMITSKMMEMEECIKEKKNRIEIFLFFKLSNSTAVVNFHV